MKTHTIHPLSTMKTTTTRILACLGLLLAGAWPAHALTITPTFTANFDTNFGANATAAKAAWNAAAAVITTNFNDPIHVNITVDAVAGTSVFGQSNTFLNSTSYANLRSLTVADAVTADDNTAISASGSMTAADPVGATHTWWVSRAQAKALGLIADDLSNDGTTTFGAGNPFTFSGTIAAGTYDFQGVCAHEITEVMGRLGLSGGTIGSSPNSYSLIDNFSYTAANTKGVGNGAGNNFSVDAGTTLLKLWNNAASNGLDSRDWASGTNDSFNQFSGPGVVNPVSTVDLQLMDAIGYNRVIATVPVGTWAPLANTAPGTLGHMHLLSNGTVMVQNDNDGGTYGPTWYLLTPDSSGHYTNGTWTTLGNANDTRLFFASQLLKDGRLFVAGGEYGTGKTTAEIYDSVANTWTTLPNPGHTFSDANSEILPDGRVLVGLVEGSLTGTLIYDPVTNAWSTGPTSNGIHNESSWVKLPDDSILMVDRLTTNAERYIPSSNTWINDSTVPVALYDPFGDETGPGFLLPNGKVIYFGAIGHTAIYTPSGTTSPGTWVAGPDIPNGQGCPDAPGAMMPNGNILLATAPIPISGNVFQSPTSFYEYDYTTNNFTQVSAPAGGITESGSSFQRGMLVLPDGTVLSSRFSTQLYVYTPTGTALAAAKPTVASVTPNGDGSYHLIGTQLNGIGEGACYGDDDQNSTNYPIVRLTSGGGTVYYARTYNWSSTSVATGSTIVSTEFTPPAGLPVGTYALSVIANGNASTAVSLNTQTLTLEQALDTTGLVWSTAGNASWFGQSTVTHDGVDAARSGAIANSQQSYMETTITGPGTITFWQKVSSESGWDFLKFSIDSVEQTDSAISGEVDWQQKSYALSAGSHTLRWTYAKDTSNGIGSDAGWVDEVVFTPAAPEIDLFRGVNPVADGGTNTLGSINVGSSSGIFTYTVKNTGNTDLTGLVLTKNGTNSADILITAPLLTTLPPGASTTFTVQFKPSAAGTRTAAIHLANNDFNENPYDVNLTGTGIGPEIDLFRGVNPVADGGTNTLGSINVGSSSGIFTYTVKNTGNTDLTGLVLTKNGTNSADILITAPLLTTLPPGASTTFTVQFKPSAAGARTAAIHLANNDFKENPYDVNLTGTGIGPEIDLFRGVNPVADGGTNTLGSVTVGSTSGIFTYTVKNTGNANLTGLVLTTNGTNRADILTTAPLLTILPPGASTTFTVKFKPGAAGARTAAIHLANNDFNENPYDINLTGIGLAAKTALAASGLPSWNELSAGNTSSLLGVPIKPTVSVVMLGGHKYLSITVTKVAGPHPRRIVEVSPNLLDWFSGPRYTTVMQNDAEFLKVRDNTPITPDHKRYIRLK